jgi:hypothetical protein
MARMQSRHDSPFNLNDVKSSSSKGDEKMSIWTILFVVLLIAWIGGFTVFHVAGGLIHLLLLFAVISLILHFVIGRRAA